MTVCKHSRLRTPALFLLAFALLSFHGCGSAPKEKKLEKDGLTLIYRSKMNAGSEIGKKKLSHPVRISEAEFTNHLLSLRYEELSLLGNKKYVFPLEGMAEMARLMTKAVNRLTPDNILAFEQDTPQGTTTGEIFSVGDRLHFKFEKIKGSEFASSSFSGWGGSTWRMAPVKGQGYYTVKKIIGSNTYENWIVADQTLPQKARRLLRKRSRPKTPPAAMDSIPGPPPASDRNGKNQDLEKKLQFLKELKEKQLIDEREFERKRKELLDTYL